MKRIRNFGLVLFFLAIISALVWGMPFDRPTDDAVVGNSSAMFILENGLFIKGDLMNWDADRILHNIFLAGVYKTFGPYPSAAKVIHVFIFAGLVLLVYKLGQFAFNERIARTAGFFTALCWTLASYTSRISREIFFVALVFLLIYFLYQAQTKKRAVWFAVAGAVFGAAVLANAVIQYFLLFIIINFLLISRQGAIKHIIPKLACFLTAFFIVMAPFTIANCLNFGCASPASSKQGYLLAMKAERMQAVQGKYLQHLVANTTGDFVAQKLFSDYDRSEARLGWETRERFHELLSEGKNGQEIDAQFTRESVRAFIRHPILFLQMNFIDFLKLNTPMIPTIRMQHMFAVPGSYPGLSDTAKIVIILGIRLVYLIFGLLILLAAIKRIKDWERMGWIILIICYFNLALSVAIGVARLSLPIYPFYIILLTVGILIVWDKFITTVEKND